MEDEEAENSILSPELLAVQLCIIKALQYMIAHTCMLLVAVGLLDYHYQYQYHDVSLTNTLNATNELFRNSEVMDRPMIS